MAGWQLFLRCRKVTAASVPGQFGRLISKASLVHVMSVCTTLLPLTHVLRSCVCSEVLNQLEEPAESAELRLKIKADDFKPIADNSISAFKQWVEEGAGGSDWQLDEPNYEGVRVKVNADGKQTGWALLRASLHDPLLVLNAESDNKGGAHLLSHSLLCACTSGSACARLLHELLPVCA